MNILNSDYYCHKSEGQLHFNPGEGTKHFAPWWCMLVCDQGIVDYYCWLSKRNGTLIIKNKLWKAHVSVIKGEDPTNKDKWGCNFGPIKFDYSNIIRYDNGRHAWLDVWCPLLHEIRAEFGLKPKVNAKGIHYKNFHLTIGRWGE